MKAEKGRYLKKGKGGVWKMTGAFFAAMLVFTLLSRAFYQHGTAVVKTGAPSGGTIGHTVRATGKIVQNQELAVTTAAGLRVASVRVNEGQQVSQGDVLFTLELDYLEETIETQKQEMKKQQLTIQNAWSQNAVSQSQQSNQQAQAEENYAAAVSQAETVLSRAQRNLERARKALEQFYQGVTDDSGEEAALLLACEEARTEAENARSALNQLQLELEQKIRDAVAQAEAQLQQAGETVPAEPILPEEPTYQEPALPEEPTYQEEPALPEEPTYQEEPALPEESIYREETTLPEETFLVAAPLSFVEPVVSAQSLTPEEREAIAAGVRAEYAQRLSEAQQRAEQAGQAEAEANAALEAFRQRQSSGTALSEQELLDAVEKAQESYEDALASLEHTKTSYGRSIASAKLPTGSSNAGQIGQITYEQMEAKLERLEALLAEEGRVLAPVDGIVTRCNVQTGEKTSDTTALLLADGSQGYKFSGLVTEEQSQYIGVGDSVTLRAGSTGKRYENLPVTTFSPTEEAGGGYRLTVQLPAGTLPLGASAELSFTRKSQLYSCCVPLSALHLDAQSRPYVLVVAQVDSVLGAQLQARKVSVTVLEQNETTAALAEGALGADDQVIISSDRAVDSGSRVRVS